MGNATMAIVQDTDVLTTAAPKRRLTMSQRESAWGLFFLSPWLIGLALFTAIPMIVSFALSFTDFNLLTPGSTKFVGIDNYLRMFSDRATTDSFLVTVKFAVLGVPLTIFLALGIAILVNQRLLIGKRVFRTFFFMPVQIPLVASTIIWIDFLNGQTGWLKFILEGIAHPLGSLISVVPGLGGVGTEFQNYLAPDWFNSTTWAVPGLVLIGVWGIGNMMLIFLAGLQAVPTELYEAARVDGAGPWSQFLHVTLPMISPVFFYNLLLNIIGAAQYFTQVYVIAGPLGNPDHQTFVYNLNLYNEAWTYNHMGYGCALAWLMFVIILGISVALFRTSARWVFYAGGDR
jgi:multiple sugar transport system permease protein